MTLKKPGDGDFEGKRTAKKIWLTAVAGVVILLGLLPLLMKQSQPALDKATGVKSARPEPVVSVPAPAAVEPPPPSSWQPLPAPERYVIERIGTYVEGDFISANYGGTSVRQYVSVKYRDDFSVYKYQIDALWAIARPGDTVKFVSDRSEGGGIRWVKSLEFPAQNKKAEARENSDQKQQ